MRTAKPYLAVLVLVLLTLALAACGAETATVAPAATGTTPPATTPARAATSQPATTTAVPTTRGEDEDGKGNPTPAATHATRPATTPALTIAAPTPAASKAPKTSGAYPGKIVYDTAYEQIFVVNPDGSGKSKVADGFSPLFSPDGKRVAFLVRNPGTAMDDRTLIIVSTKLDGSDRQELCATYGNGQARLVRWSPRNRFIAMTGTQRVAPASLYLCDLNTKKLESVDTKQGGVAEIFDWTPDGENAIWQAETGLDYFLYYGDPDKGGNGAVKVQAGPYKSTFEGGQYQYYPTARISPDGKTIAVGGGGLYMTSVPGQKSPLDGYKGIGGTVEHLAWSPDGRALVIIGLAPALNEPVRFLNIQPIASDAPSAGLEISENVGTSVDWTRQ